MKLPVRSFYRPYTRDGTVEDLREILLGMMDEVYSSQGIVATTRLDEMSKRITWPGTVFELEREYAEEPW